MVRTKWLVHKDAREGIDYDVENLTGVWNATNAQDAALVEMAQAGARTPAYEPGPYSPYTETLVEKFAKWYLGRLSAGLTLMSASPLAADIGARPLGAAAWA